MKIKLDEEESVKSFKQKCCQVSTLIKTVVVVVCTGVVVQQITTCVTKLINVPITTYTHFDFNKTIIYPTVTFCREPAYKYRKLLDYGLYAHPRYTSTWRNFNFSQDLDAMWHDITYDAEDMFLLYGLDSEVDNVDIKSTTGFHYGRCHSLVPRAASARASRQSGYSITLVHDDDIEAHQAGLHQPGFHVFVHFSKEPFTEVEVYNGGLVDYLYVNVAETVDVKLTVDAYVKISSSDDPCIFRSGYSANMCTTSRVWRLVEKEVGCSGPWMTSDLPRCNNFTNMRNLISNYLNLYTNHNVTGMQCPRYCEALLYNAYVTDRQKDYTWDTAAGLWDRRRGSAQLQSQLYIHFNSKMVSVYEERYNYDWNIFVSDLGGSIGFLLGLSVIGLIKVMGRVWPTILQVYAVFKARKYNSSVADSTSTIPADHKFDPDDTDIFRVCDWQVKSKMDNA